MSLTLKKTQIPIPELHLLVCINSREHLPEPKLPYCISPTFSKEDLNELRTWFKDEKLLLRVKLTATHCLGMCSKEGSICLLYPHYEYYIFNTIEDLKKLIIRKLSSVNI